MFGLIIRPFRSIGRTLGRTPIESREQQTLSDTRKTLLTYRSARENSKAEVNKYTERVERLREAKLVEEARLPEKRTFDWARFDNNTLITAIKDDLYEAEKKLHEELANYESNDAMVGMFEKREARVMASLELRASSAPVAPKVAIPTDSRELGVEYNPANGQIDLIPAKGESLASMARPAINGAPRVDRAGTQDRTTPSSMGGLVTS